MIKDRLKRALSWSVRHFLITWAIFIVLYGAMVTTFDVNIPLNTAIVFIGVAPFKFLDYLIGPLELHYGEVVAGAVHVALVLCIYVLLDVLLWAFIRAARRGANSPQQGRSGGPGRLRGAVDWTCYWAAQHMLPIWAVVASCLMFATDHLDIQYGATGFKGTILYMGLLVSFPINALAAFLHGAGLIDFNDSRHIVAACVVVACIVVNFMIRRRRRAKQLSQGRDISID